MKRTITSLVVVVCALLTTSFVLPADKKSHTQQNRPLLEDVDLEISASTWYSGIFEVVFRKPGTDEEYYFYLSGSGWTHGGIPEGVYEVRLNTLSGSSYQYAMYACAQKVISNGPVTTNVCVGYPGSYQFYITNYVN